MAISRRAHLLAVALMVVALLVSSVGASPTRAQDQGSAGNPNAASQEAQLLDRGALISHNTETGKVGFVGMTQGSALARPPGLAANAPPETAAREHLAELGDLFGIEDQSRELHKKSAEEVDGGRSVVGFQQVYEGVPVLAGELNVQLDGDNELLVANGEALPDISLDVEPSVGAEEARQTAIGKVAKDYGVEAGNLRATEPELWIYDPALLGGPGLQVPQLVWRTEVTDGDLVEIRELVLVDAEEHNSIALNFSEIAHAKARFVCDRTNVPGASAHCLSPTDGYARTEDQAATGVSEVDAAYDYMGDTYDFYKNRLGRDSIDGAGMDLRATVRWCPNSTECPYRNAFWNGAQAIFGDGYAATDDIVAHELTHGVTDYESNLKYYYQSGAINESFSDIFGEFVDLTNGKGTDTAATRWIHGEDTPQSSQRNMKDPPATPGSPRPDRMTSPYYVATAHLEDANGVDPDAGGIHYNSGVGNKAAYLITDGATFNGYTVTGLGINKAAKIYYEVQTNLLTSGSDYQDLYAALPQACTNLIGTANITSANCQEVKDAVNATEMNLQPTTAPAPEAPVCDAGQQNMDLFFDDMENTASGNWQTQTLVGTQPWFFGTGQNSYATSGVTNLIGIDVATRSDFTALMAQSVQVPTGKTTYLHFKHAHGFEDNNAGTYYDGGVVEYSTGGGSTWEDLASKFTHNGPAGTISASRDNPLGGRQGFIGDSNGYISSRANLSSLAGQGVRLRWRIGTDSTFRDDSWWIDDVRIYTCGAADTIPPKVMNTSPATIAPTANVTAIFSEAMDASPTEADGDPSTISGTTFKLVKLKSYGTTTGVTAAVSYSPATTKAILNPSSNLSLGATYKATVTTGAQDWANNALDQNPNVADNQPKNWKFRVQ